METETQNRLLSEATSCKRRYDFNGAVQVLRRAHKLDPTNDKILIDLGSACAQAYDFSSAEQYFEAAVCHASSKINALNSIGEAWMDLLQFDAAGKCFERAFEYGIPPVSAFVRLVRVYIRKHKLDAAMETVQRGLHLHGPDAGLVLMRAKVLRRMKQPDDAEQLLREIISTNAYPVETRAWCLYELGTLLDEQSCYDAAMSSFLRAKTLLRLTAGPALKALQMKQNQLREMVEKVEHNPLPRWRKSAVTDLQPRRNLSLLCSYPRSGTTLMEYVLDAHPQVISADETTVFHNVAYFPLSNRSSPSSSFISVLDSMPARQLREIRAEYFRGMESFLGESIGSRLLLDKNPSYTFDLPTILRIFPEIKVLFALRDPRDVCLSCFMQPAPMIADMSAWLTLEGTVQHYSHVMNLWLAWRPWIGDQGTEVRYEEMVQDLEGESKRTLDFLGLPWDESLRNFNERAQTKVVRSPTFAEVSRPVYKTSVARWRNYEKYLEPHVSNLSRFLNAFGYS